MRAHPVARQAVAGCRAGARAARRPLLVAAAVHARWTIDARYGCKQEATALLQEWVATVGARAGLTPRNTRLSSGAVGVHESRLEMETTWESLAAFETFLGRVPLHEHKAWSQRVRNLVVDGSPMWQVHHSIPVMAPEQFSAAGAQQQLQQQQQQRQPAAADAPQLVIADQLSPQDMAAWAELKGGIGTSSSGSSSGDEAPQPAPAAAPDGADQAASSGGGQQRVPLDWKGEPMQINPGDKLPFKFL